MSHVPLIGGSLSSSAEYQEYLARLGAHRRASRGASSTGELRTFDSAIDPDRDGGHGNGATADDDDEPADGETGPDQDPGPGPGLSIKA
jgi:hypothetical protein